MPKVSILIPVFNAEQTIGRLCMSLIHLYAAKYILNIILVNDCSRDGSDAVCRDLCARYPETITYIKLSKNFGEHNALLAGMHHVSCDYCVMMDDDLQNPPEEVEKLIDEIRTGYDVVYARYLAREDNIFRKMGSAFHNKVANVTLGKPASLYLSSFKVINQFLVDEIAKYDGTDPYIDGIILRSTGNIGTVTVTHHERPYGSSQYTLGKLVSLWGSMVINFSMFPFRMIGMSGFLVLVFGLTYGAYKAIDDINTYGTLTEYETIMSVNMVFRGIGMLAISVLGEYVGRIYLSANKKPQFVIREIVPARKKDGTAENVITFRTRDGG